MLMADESFGHDSGSLPLVRMAEKDKGWLGFLLSHPCDGKKSQGWGTLNVLAC